MVEIIGNNIASIINDRVSEVKNPEEKRKELMDELGKHIHQNRLTGLIKGTYQINRNEIWTVKEVLGCETADEIVIVRNRTTETVG